jgi:SprT protein
MPVSEHPMQALAAFLPDGSFEKVVQYIHHYKVHLNHQQTTQICARRLPPLGLGRQSPHQRKWQP